MSKEVSVLFTRKDSYYNSIECCDCYDIERNALTFTGGNPVIAHPPCRSWGRLRHFAKPLPGEKALAVWAVYMVRECGGVLEHPASSMLWRELNLPLGAQKDKYGGFTIDIDQFWFGHKARKKTWLYVCGINRQDVPAVPLKFGRATHTISTFSKLKNPTLRRPQVTKKEREYTPPDLAEWLVDLALLIGKNQQP